MSQQNGGGQYHNTHGLQLIKDLSLGMGKGAAPFQSAIIYLGKNLDRFNDVFGKYGNFICAT